MAPTSTLHLYEELTLLCLKDKKGTVAVAHLAQVLSGALAAELILLNRISVEKGRKKMVDVSDTTPIGDPLLDECLEKLATAKRRARLSRWINRFAAIKNLHHRAADNLCQRGILQKTTDTILFLFNRTVYPELDPVPEQRLIARIEAALFSNNEELETNDVIVISLANSVGLLEKISGRKRLKPYRKRIKHIADGNAAAKATQEVIQAIQSVIIAGAVGAAVVVTS